MDIKKWIPWNWFKKEEEDGGKPLPVHHGSAPAARHVPENPIRRLHAEIDRLFDQTFRSMGMGWPAGTREPPLMSHLPDGLLKPTLDLGATDKAYSISVEIPGVDEKDIRLEIANNILTIQGEKNQAKEEKDRNFYRMERSYGAFQRVLSLPEDADQESVEAKFRKGVLTITLPRKSLPQQQVKRITVTGEG